MTGVTHSCADTETERQPSVGSESNAVIRILSAKPFGDGEGSRASTTVLNAWHLSGVAGTSADARGSTVLLLGIIFLQAQLCIEDV